MGDSGGLEEGGKAHVGLGWAELIREGPSCLLTGTHSIPDPWHLHASVHSRSRASHTCYFEVVQFVRNREKRGPGVDVREIVVFQQL